jgi:uncharacterized membrane protein YhaH (DUF805 family)
MVFKISVNAARYLSQESSVGTSIKSPFRNKNMPTVECPRCRLVNPDTAQRCDCGYDFSTKTAEKMQKGLMKGRISGPQYFMWYAPSFLLSAALKYDLFRAPWDAAVALLYLLSLVLAVIAAVRRSHDLGRSGWFALICLIPFAGWYLVFKKGNVGLNQYGPPPR